MSPYGPPAPPAPPTVASSSSTQPFPRISSHQRDQLQQILNHCHPQAHTWAQLTQARTNTKLHARSPPGATTDDDNDDDVFPLLLALTWQDGTTWHRKWENAQRSLAEQQQQQNDGKATVSGTRGGHHRRRPSDGVDLLKQRLANVTLDPPASTSKTPQRPPSTPLESGIRGGPTSRFSRPQSTPPSQAPTPRPLLIPADAGHSSSDDYVGVPRALNNSGPLQRAIEREDRRARQEGKADRRLSRGAAAVLDATRRAPIATTAAGAAVEATPEARHPLLQRRLAQLSHATADSPSSPSPAARTAHIQHPINPTLPPASHRPPRPHSPLSSLPDLISGQYSPPEADAIALSFSRLRLLGSSFDLWRAGYEFQRARTDELDRRRERWLGRCVLQGWGVRVRKLREAGNRADEFARARENGKRKRVLRNALIRWREKRREREADREEEEKKVEREKRETELRHARDSVARIRNRGVAKRALERWYHAHLRSRSESFRRSSLLRTTLSTLQLRLHAHLHRTRTLAEIADEQWLTSEGCRVRGALVEWKRRAEIRVRERQHREESDSGLKSRVFEEWVDKRQRAQYLRDLDAAADQHYAVSLASSAIAAWKRRKRRVDSLSTAALSHSTHLLAQHSHSLLTHWRLSTRLSLSLQSSSSQLTSRALSAWLNKYEHLEVELSGRALALISRKDSQLKLVSFSAWSDATAHHQRLNQAASALDRRRSLSAGLKKWIERERKRKVEERKAEVVREFFGQRGAWRKWVERVWELRRQRWVEEKKTGRKREALEFWLAQTRQKQQDRRLVEQVQEQQKKRALSTAVCRWKNRVILRGELEDQASKLFERNLLQAGFKRWADQTVKAAERLLFADEHRALKLEELRDRTFHSWLASTRRSLDLKQRLAEHTAAKQARLREDTFGTWRERSLRRVENQVLLKRQNTLRRTGWERWKDRSKAPTATQFYTSRLTLRAFSTWQHWTPPLELARQAVETDKTSISSGALQVWRIKAQAKIALKGLSRLRHIGSSPSASPPTPRATSIRPLPANTVQATPTPSLPRQPPLNRIAPASASPSSSASLSSSAFSPSTLGSINRSSASALTAATTPSPSTSTSYHRPSLPPSSHPRLSSSSLLSTPTAPPPSLLAARDSTSTRSKPTGGGLSNRPRLSQEYSALPSPSPSRPATTRTRTRSRSSSSMRSVQTPRSAPAGVSLTDSEDDGDDAGDGRGGGEEEEEPDLLSRLRRSTSTRGRGGGGGGSRGIPGPRSEGREPSEDGSVSSLNGGEGGGRDVRGEYAALRARLQEAAVRARRGV